MQITVADDLLDFFRSFCKENERRRKFFERYSIGIIADFIGLAEKHAPLWQEIEKRSMVHHYLKFTAISPFVTIATIQ